MPSRHLTFFGLAALLTIAAGCNSPLDQRDIDAPPTADLSSNDIGMLLEDSVPGPCADIVDVSALQTACVVQWGDLEVTYLGTGFSAGVDLVLVEGEIGGWAAPPTLEAADCKSVPVDIGVPPPQVILAGEVLIRDVNPGGPAPLRVLVSYC